jgi:tellurite resistance protein TerC
VPRESQPSVLGWGIVLALLLRLVFILVGAALIHSFQATFYVFGVLLLYTAYKLARHDDIEIHPEHNPVLRLVRRVLPMGHDYEGERLISRRSGRWLATPLFAVFVVVATTDLIFAIDSIPAIFAVTRDTFVVFAANAFSLLGMVSLFFVLDGLLERFRHLHLGLAAILLYVAAKMLLVDVWHPPLALSLAVIVGALAVAMATSAIAERRERDRASPAGS